MEVEMKKFLIVILILLILFGGYLLYDTKFKEKIPVLEIQEEVININELYIYGTHLNLHGNIVNGNNQKANYDLNELSDTAPVNYPSEGGGHYSEEEYSAQRRQSNLHRERGEF